MSLYTPDEETKENMDAAYFYGLMESQEVVGFLKGLLQLGVEFSPAEIKEFIIMKMNVNSQRELASMTSTSQCDCSNKEGTEL
jgi:hypothetical protein